MIGSVRGRLTTAVVLVVGTIAVVTALLAPPWIERALIDDRLDAEVAAERIALGALTEPSEQSEQDEPSSVDAASPELTAIFGPEIAELAVSLEAVDALDPIRAQRDDGKVVVMPVPGVLGEIGTDGRVRVDERHPDAAGGPIVTGARLRSLSDRLTTAGIFDSPFEILGEDGTFEDFLAELEGRFGADLGERLDLGELGRFGEELLGNDVVRELIESQLDDLPLPAAGASVPSADELVFGTREVSGVEVIVAASPDGLDLTIDRLRTALWASVPIVMALTGLVTWLLAGRALRPVRAITERTRRIRGGTLHERVPVPRSDDEVAALAAEMNDMLDRLQAEDRRRRQFVADASHELRSPLASIQTQAEVALAADGDAETADLAGGVLAEAQRLGTIVDDLLALARHDEALAPPGAVIDLDDIVLAAAARPRRVPVDTSHVSAGQVRGHTDELRRAVTHLLDNAARHANRSIRVSLAAGDGRVLLIVDDDGPGIPPADRERVFERFVRLDGARVRDDGGAGLGLAVVATVVTAAGGSVAVTDSDLGGASFLVTLPPAF